MKDVQKEPDNRNIAIDRVGVRGVSYPVTVMDRVNGSQNTVADVSMSVQLPHEYRGTHMSRFIEALEEHKGVLGPSALDGLTSRMCEKLDALESEVRFEFPYFVRKAAPVSGISSLTRYEAGLFGIRKNGVFDIITGVSVPVQTLCPCSKEISSHGAHNQRAEVLLKVRMNELVWFEELIQIAERSASTPLYTLLKREDEKYVTERAYDNPRFVEDVVRDIAVEMNDDARITWYDITVVSAESIHNHDAFAELRGNKRKTAKA
ncbi:GTP cyclohydrolase FolE2 [Synergistales bacterium]|nr:GTP cyclohydrolase FolE2 [Synergistales bacterium]